VRDQGRLKREATQSSIGILDSDERRFSDSNARNHGAVNELPFWITSVLPRRIAFLTNPTPFTNTWTPSANPDFRNSWCQILP
jgi:hypothetical protein